MYLHVKKAIRLLFLWFLLHQVASIHRRFHWFLQELMKLKGMGVNQEQKAYSVVPIIITFLLMVICYSQSLVVTC